MKTLIRSVVLLLLINTVQAQLLEVKPDRVAIVKEGPYGNAPEVTRLPAGARAIQLGEAPRYFSIRTTNNVTGWSYKGSFVVIDTNTPPVEVTPETLLARSDVLKIIIIDVEVGDATLIICPQEANGDRDVLLVDCGESNDGGRIREELIRQGLELTGRPITRVYSSHYDDDHIGSIKDIAPLCEVAYDHGPNKQRSYYRNAMLNNQVDRRTIALSYVETFSGGVTVDCVAVNRKTDTDQAATPSSDDNANSVALEISFGAFDYFTAGDLPFEVENKLTNTVRNCDFYHVNHHGSRTTSSGLDFVQALDPEVSVASNGTRHGHPNEEVATRLINEVGSKFFQTNWNPDNRAHHPSPEFVADDTFSSTGEENAEGALGNITIVVDPQADRYYVIMPGLQLSQATFQIEH